VLLDVRLPDGDGVDLLREIRGSALATVPVMMLSSEVEVASRIHGLRTGADEYIGKPYDTAYVLGRARQLVREKQGDDGADHKAVLVIDDSLTFREELRAALEGEGYAVEVAGSGEEGLRIAADLLPVAIVVDGVLPGIDGATVIRRIRLDTALRHTPCLLLTASEGAGAELRALEAGADAFVRKEVDIAVILARFTATLRSAENRAAGPQRTSSLGPKRILAVDDSDTYLQALTSALRGEGYDIVLAHTGEEALELLAVQPVDCILLDLMMPGIGGQETCLRIKAAPVLREIPLIMLTARDEQDAMLAGLGAGADDYLTKSNDFEVLRARVRAQIRRRQFEDENRRFREQILRMEMDASEAAAARELAEIRANLVEQLERKNRELEAFSYSVSHDLRAPLRSIDGFSKLLLDDYVAHLDPVAQDYLSRVRGAARRMGELIDDLLELSKVGRMELRLERVDLSRLAREIAAELTRSDPGRRVEWTIADDITAHGDPRLLRVVLDNLLGNAWKFTAKTESATIQFTATHEAARTVYAVRDNGAGFDMAYASKLFGAFQRLHPEREFAGTGIGLATVQRIVDRHGGDIWAEGAVGRGATLSWTLPAAKPDGRT
ncbi:MAG TPA: response regulator, partial [Nannocystaceae bacterium]|nr:response regulator [Nannocystaceae bacterium]